MKPQGIEGAGGCIKGESHVLISDFGKFRVKQKAERKGRNPATGEDQMMLSWYCGKTGEYYPKTECGRSDKPPWIIFAESRGADIAININDGEYVFLYLSL